eukprot:3723485-Prymnesium_polylepis.1
MRAMRDEANIKIDRTCACACTWRAHVHVHVACACSCVLQSKPGVYVSRAERRRLSIQRQHRTISTGQRPIRGVVNAPRVRPQSTSRWPPDTSSNTADR